MALKFFWRCEGTTLDGTHDFTSGDSTATLVSAAAINTDAAIYGTNGLDCPTASDYAEFAVSSGDIISSSVGAFGFSFRLAAFVVGARLFAAVNSAAGNNNIVTELIGSDTSTGRELLLRIRLQGGLNATLQTSDADLQLNTVYGVVMRHDEPNSARRIEVYNADGTLRTSVEDLTTNFDQPSGIDLLRIGESAGGAIDAHIDNVFIADDYSEPLENFLDITSYTEYGIIGGSFPPIRRPPLTVFRPRI